MRIYHSNRYVFFVLTIVVLCYTVPAMARDGERKGFVLGGGLGVGRTSQEIAVDGRVEDASDLALFTNFIVGYAPTRTLVVYYNHKGIWFNSNGTTLNTLPSGEVEQHATDRLLTNGFAGLGVRYYLKPEMKSWFVAGGLGIAWWAQVFEESTDCIKLPLLIPCTEQTGPGFFVGGGYEFVRHVTTEFNLIWGNLSDETGRIEVGSNSITLVFTLNYLFY